MSSGSYYPKPVRQVLIPKGDGKFRPLGIPTVADRVAQMAVKKVLEARMESLFHPWSYGYRPGKNAKQAVARARQNCWSFDWVVDMDIRAFFDTIDHGLMMRAVEKHVPEKWIRLYIERWLKCAVQLADGTVESPRCGVPQGGVISPLLANLYCITPSMPGCGVIIATCRLSGTRMMCCVTVAANRRLNAFYKLYGNDSPTVDLTCTRIKHRWCIARTTRGAGNIPRPVLTFWGSVFTPELSKTSKATCLPASAQE